MNLKSEGGKTATIAMLIPDPDDLLALEPEELAGVILECLDTTYGTGLNRYNLLRPPSTLAGYKQGDQEKISRAMTEAWIWLEREGFLAP